MCYFSFVLLLLAALPARAQIATPDTLDWRGYVPLEIGNHWQYEVENLVGGGFGVVRRNVEDWRIVGDTTVGGRDYVVAARRCGTFFFRYAEIHSYELCDPTAVDTILVRYDEENASLVQYGGRHQGVPYDRPWEASAGAGVSTYRLDAPFSSTPPDILPYQTSGYDLSTPVGRDTVVVARKVFTGVGHAVTVEEAFAHGIGYLGGLASELGGISKMLTYARVGESAYGRKQKFPRTLLPDEHEWVIADTLDWHGYYPLDVGSAWEVEGYTLVAYYYNEFREIVADTLLGGYKYAVQVRHFREQDRVIEHDVSGIDTLLLRHRSDGHVVGMALGASEEEVYTPDLDEHFNTRTENGGQLGLPGGYTNGYGLYELETVGVTAPAFKRTSFFGGDLYIHGIGPIRQVGDGAQGWYRFNYVRLGGEEYGARAFFPVANDPAERAPEPTAALYPNPAAAALHLRLTGTRGESTLRLYDVLGREALPAQQCAASCEVDVSALAPGVYSARVALGGGGAVTRRVVVAR